MKISRNDPCICQSGFKYKQCCLDGKKIDRWVKNAYPILNSPNNGVIHKTFFEVINFIEKEQWQGACHASSSVLHILLSEQGINNELFIGEVKAPNGKPFDHSWIEIDGNIFDVSIFNPLEHEGKIYPPVYNGYDLDTQQNTELEYGIDSGYGYNNHAATIKNTPFNDYMLGLTSIPNGLYGTVVDLAKSLNLSLSAERLINKYSQTEWKERIKQS